MRWNGIGAVEWFRHRIVPCSIVLILLVLNWLSRQFHWEWRSLTHVCRIPTSFAQCLCLRLRLRLTTLFSRQHTHRHYTRYSVLTSCIRRTVCSTMYVVVKRAALYKLKHQILCKVEFVRRIFSILFLFRSPCSVHQMVFVQWLSLCGRLWVNFNFTNWMLSIL